MFIHREIATAAFIIGALTMAQAQSDDLSGSQMTRAKITFIQDQTNKITQQDQRPTELTLAVPYQYEITDKVRKTYASKTVDHMRLYRDTAMTVALNNQPTQDNIFSWKGNKSSLKGKTFILRLTTSKDPLLAQNGKSPLGVSDSADAATAVLQTQNERSIVTLILVDRIFYDQRNVPREDALARFIVTLGHELFGNVTRWLNEKNASGAPDTLTDRINYEQEAYKAEFDFIERLKKTAPWSKFPEKTKREINAVLEEDKKVLQTLKN